MSHRSAGIKNNTRGTLSVTCGDWWVFADYPAGIKNNTRDINTVIAKNCNRYRADAHIVSLQFCGNLPLFYTFTDTYYYNPQ